MKTQRQRRTGGIGRWRAAAAVASILLGLLGASIASAPIAGAHAATSASTSEWRSYDLINQERAARGLGAMQMSATLVQHAREHSQAMANSNGIFHSNLSAIAHACSNQRGGGENVGSGGSVDAVHGGFMGSQIHKDAILGAYNYVGTGVVVKDGVNYVTQMFVNCPTAIPALSKPAPPPPPPPPPCATCFVPYGGFGGGAYVAAGNLFGDANPEFVTGAGAGGAPHVRVFNANRSAAGGDFMAYGETFGGGVDVAIGDVDGDGYGEIITAAGPGGGPHVAIWKRQPNGTYAYLSGVFAYDNWPNGVYVSAGDIDGDGKAEIVTGPGAGGGPHVKVFKYNPTTKAVTALGGGQFVYAANMGAGVDVAVGDVDGDKKAEVITGAGPNAGPHVRVFKVSATGAFSLLSESFVYSSGVTSGVRVAAADRNGDGKAEVITSPWKSFPAHVRVMNPMTGWSEVAAFYAFPTTYSGGADVAGTSTLLVQGMMSAGQGGTGSQVRTS